MAIFSDICYTIRDRTSYGGKEQRQMINFPEGYFNEEYRDGFLVPSMMKRYWASQMEILSEIDRICGKYGLQYFAESGTMLGAVRHQGFIPWDDDIDISMRREDYTRFLDVASGELKEGWHLLDIHRSGGVIRAQDYFARVLNSTGIRTDSEFLDEFHGCPYISGVDIFPLDYIPRDEEERKLQKNLVTVVNHIAVDLSRGREVDNLEGYIAWIQEMTGYTLNGDSPVYVQLACLVDDLCRMYAREEADCIGMIPYFTERYEGVPVACYDTVEMMPFETIMIPVPSGYDTILTARFGEYMIPDGKPRDSWPIYQNQEKILKERLKKSK